MQGSHTSGKGKEKAVRGPVQAPLNVPLGMGPSCVDFKQLWCRRCGAPWLELVQVDAGRVWVLGL